jgi:hypothetical protein
MNTSATIILIFISNFNSQPFFELYIYFNTLTFYAIICYITGTLPNIYIYTGLFISPSGISELCSAITKTDTAERSVSTDRETLQVCNASSWRTCGFYR